MEKVKHKKAENSVIGHIPDEVLRKVINLARLDPLGPAMALQKEHLRKILDHFSVLSRIDITDVDPTIHINPAELPLRDDTPVDVLAIEDAMSNARNRTQEYFLAPGILDTCEKRVD